MDEDAAAAPYEGSKDKFLHARWLRDFPGAPADISKVAGALAKAKLDFKPVHKAKTAKVKGQTRDGRAYEYEYKYADLAAVIDATSEALSKNGLAIVQPIIWRDNQMFINTVLVHESGQSIGSDFPVSTQPDIQKTGAAITYIRRYAMSSLLGIASEDDTDAQEVEPQQTQGSVGTTRGRKPGKDASVLRPVDPAPSNPSGGEGEFISPQAAKHYIERAKIAGLSMDEAKALMVEVAGVDKSGEVKLSSYTALMARVEALIPKGPE